MVKLENDFSLHLRQIESRIDELAEIGQSSYANGGITRLAMTPEDALARDCVINWMRQLGLMIRIDKAGNLIGRREGLSPELAAVAAGSHIDTVPDGGKFDGTLGVAGALEVVDALNQNGIRHRRPLEIIVFNMEESSRFGLAMLGSKSIAGRLDPRFLEHCRDNRGILLGDCLRAWGLDPDVLVRKEDVPSYHAFLELHIEQGSLLRDGGQQIGIVTDIAAPIRLRVGLKGEAAHTGATSFEKRRDALVASALVIEAVEELTKRESLWKTVATVGQLEVSPNVMNVVPGKTELGIDIRGVSVDSRRRLARSIIKTVGKVAARRGLQVELTVLTDEEPVQLSPHIVALLAKSCEEEGLTSVKMPSLAGHDAMEMAGITEAGMILIRNMSGTSHSPSEQVTPEDIAAGWLVLKNALCRLIEPVFDGR